VRDWPRLPAKRQPAGGFVGDLPVSHVLGAHVEMKKTAREMYPLGSRFQPDEHPLPLTRNTSEPGGKPAKPMGDTLHTMSTTSFIIEPV